MSKAFEGTKQETSEFRPIEEGAGQLRITMKFKGTLHERVWNSQHEQIGILKKIKQLFVI
jgi:hypothetical protein